MTRPAFPAQSSCALLHKTANLFHQDMRGSSTLHSACFENRVTRNPELGATLAGCASDRGREAMRPLKATRCGPADCRIDTRTQNSGHSTNPTQQKCPPAFGHGPDANSCQGCNKTTVAFILTRPQFYMNSMERPSWGFPAAYGIRINEPWKPTHFCHSS